jgi:hypothetical protein
MVVVVFGVVVVEDFTLVVGAMVVWAGTAT